MEYNFKQNIFKITDCKAKCIIFCITYADSSMFEYFGKKVMPDGSAPKFPVIPPSGECNSHPFYPGPAQATPLSPFFKLPKPDSGKHIL